MEICESGHEKGGLVLVATGLSREKRTSLNRTMWQLGEKANRLPITALSHFLAS